MFLSGNFKLKFFIFTLYPLLLLFLFIVPVNTIYAQTQPIPFPTGVPCDETRPQEFHSLRPYQASPCNPDATDLALFCGNDFILIDTVTITKNYSDGSTLLGLDWEYDFEGNPIDPSQEQPPDSGLGCSYCNGNGNCVPRNPPCIPDLGCQNDSSNCTTPLCVNNGDGTETCNFIIDRTVDIVVDLAGADLPIMGFTEPSQGSTEPERVVNSVFQGNETVTDAQKVNEYVSWYLNGTIGRAEYDPPDSDSEEDHHRIVDFSGPLKRLLAFESQIVERIQEVVDARAGDIRHNQIIGCRSGDDPVECYSGNPIRVRLSYWIDDYFPPLRRAFDTVEDYIAAFQQWRDDTYWRLFSYIPFSSTEDRKGEVEIDEYTIQPPMSSNIVILNSAITNQEPAELFFAHMQETVELGDLLQKIFSPQDADLEADPLNISPPLAPLCDIAEVRTNPGDDLFATEISATVEYTAQVTCEYIYPGGVGVGRVCNAALGDDPTADNCYDMPQIGWVCDTWYGQVDCPSGQFCGDNCDVPQHCDGRNCGGADGGCCFGYECDGYDPVTLTPGHCDREDVDIDAFSYTETCTNQVPITFHTITKTPLADRVWTKLVSGPAGVFRRLFPQIEDVEGRPIRRLWDIPAATDVIYRSLSGNITVAGGNNQQLYFPHIGGVHEYFLNCIQKTLRPQGYGRGCITGPPPLSHLNPPGSGGACAAPPPPGGSVVGAGVCEVGGGFCSPSYLMSITQGYDGQGWDPHAACIASIICNRESGGNPSAINCGCLTGTSVDYSVGLFQINLLSHSTPDLRCYDAFEYSCTYSWCDIQGPVGCTILDQNVVDQCADYYFDPTNNIIKAYQMSLGGTRWDPWAAGTSCATELAACP